MFDGDGPALLKFKIQVHELLHTIEARESETVGRFIDTCARRFKEEFASRMITVMHEGVDLRTVARRSELDELNINESSLLHITNRTTVPAGTSTGPITLTVRRITGAHIVLTGIPSDW